MNIYEDITLIYVCYNSTKLIKKNINNIKKFKSIIVDNANSFELSTIIKKIDNITYINTSKNLGYGRANNIGVSYAKTPYVLILNPDIYFETNSIDELLKAFTSFDNVGVAAPSLYDQNNNRRSNSSLSYLKKKIHRSKFNKKIYNDVLNTNTDGPLCCDYLIGCALLFNKSFFLEIGGFDDSFFMYFEDNEICDRINKNNKIVLEVPKSKMVHLQGESSTLNFFTKSKISIIHKISEYIYLKKNIKRHLLFFFIFKNFFDFFQRFIFSLLTLKFKKSYKNFLRIISIFFFITNLYLFLYR